MSLSLSTPTKIVDAFIYYNELNLLRYRLEILYDVVDYFVIIESTRTFVGKDRSLDTLLGNATGNVTNEYLRKFADKIVYVLVDDLDENPASPWDNETKQRNAIDAGIRKIAGLQPTDLLLISDVDEIPNPKIICRIKTGQLQVNNYACMVYDFYYYNLECKNLAKWTEAKVMTVDFYINMLENMPQRCRQYATENMVKMAGWHLSYFGDAEFIKNKIENFSHQEFNTNEIKKNIADKIISGKDLFGRTHEQWQFIDMTHNGFLPPQLEYLKSLFATPKQNDHDHDFDVDCDYNCNTTSSSQSSSPRVIEFNI